MIVCEDADLERAARGAVYGAFSNAGQVCTSTERVYVVDRVADAFTRKVVAETGGCARAPGEFDVGAIIASRSSASSRSTCATPSRAGRACWRAGAAIRPYGGLFFEPTVLVDVDHDMKVMREETFGPVLPIMRVRDEDEALASRTTRPYGLNANVWTRNKRKGTSSRRRSSRAASSSTTACSPTASPSPRSAA